MSITSINKYNHLCNITVSFFFLPDKYQIQIPFFHLPIRILEEEFAKREELERLQAEQGQQLLQEQMSRQELQAAHRAQEEALLNAQAQLEALTMERLEADRNLQVCSIV